MKRIGRLSRGVHREDLGKGKRACLVINPRTTELFSSFEIVSRICPWVDPTTTKKNKAQTKQFAPVTRPTLATRQREIRFLFSTYTVWDGVMVTIKGNLEMGATLRWEGKKNLKLSCRCPKQRVGDPKMGSRCILHRAWSIQPLVRVLPSRQTLFHSSCPSRVGMCRSCPFHRSNAVFWRKKRKKRMREKRVEERYWENNGLPLDSPSPSLSPLPSGTQTQSHNLRTFMLSTHWLECPYLQWPILRVTECVQRLTMSAYTHSLGKKSTEKRKRKEKANAHSEDFHVLPRHWSHDSWAPVFRQSRHGLWCSLIPSTNALLLEQEAADLLTPSHWHQMAWKQKKKDPHFCSSNTTIKGSRSSSSSLVPALPFSLPQSTQAQQAHIKPWSSLPSPLSSPPLSPLPFLLTPPLLATTAASRKETIPPIALAHATTLSVVKNWCSSPSRKRYDNTCVTTDRVSFHFFFGLLQNSYMQCVKMGDSHSDCLKWCRD